MVRILVETVDFDCPFIVSLEDFKRLFFTMKHYCNSATKIAGNPPELIWREYLSLI